MSYVAIRESLATASDDLKRRFEAGESVASLVHARSALIDDLLLRLWNDHALHDDAALVAVGGYGRGELHPASDVDIMILLPESLPKASEEALSAFITSLWDIGLEIGHSVR
ncbi:MAG: nucleotidyltransferase domain-containing protein, partial [Gammaproteobacteria bacterium]|nr:nucleotidyltransferase domain-containing protein [Gammaproteobacteria bacterium]